MVDGYNTYVNFENGKTRLNDETFNKLQDLIKKDIENKILENNKLMYPIRFYICNTR